MKKRRRSYILQCGCAGMSKIEREVNCKPIAYKRSCLLEGALTCADSCGDACDDRDDDACGALVACVCDACDASDAIFYGDGVEEL